MLNYIWPIALVVGSNILYQICCKSVPDTMDPFASLTVSYAIAAVVSFFMFYALNRGGSIIREYAELSWAPIALGIVIVGLEVGFIFAYKAGWPVSTASIVQSSFLAVALLFVGYMLYNEALSVKKIVGMLICLVGLYIINTAK